MNAVGVLLHDFFRLVIYLFIAALCVGIWAGVRNWVSDVRLAKRRPELPPRRPALPMKETPPAAGSKTTPSLPNTGRSAAPQEPAIVEFMLRMVRVFGADGGPSELRPVPRNPEWPELVTTRDADGLLTVFLPPELLESQLGLFLRFVERRYKQVRLVIAGEPAEVLADLAIEAHSRGYNVSRHHATQGAETRWLIERNGGSQR
jgi:hypothetical protein